VKIFFFFGERRILSEKDSPFLMKTFFFFLCIDKGSEGHKIIDSLEAWVSCDEQEDLFLVWLALV